MAAKAHVKDLGDGRRRILEAALEEFATFGVDGTTLRQVAERAGTQHQLIVYHFKSKDALWKAVVADICVIGRTMMLTLERDAKALGPAAALRQLVREMVHLTARQPQLHRMLTFEGRSDNERLRWWIFEYVRDFYALSTRLIREAQKAGVARPGNPGRLHYALIGIATTSFVFEPEYRAMTKIDPFSPREIEAVTDLACDFLGLPPHAPADQPRRRPR
ncbi:MAG: TetR family transcriptional regulator [Alphaproteobacteria bacterium]|nr:TetR family transcriptional regulator [Alphaproteobacteria bacterium]